MDWGSVAAGVDNLRQNLMSQRWKMEKYEVCLRTI